MGKIIMQKIADTAKSCVSCAANLFLSLWIFLGIITISFASETSAKNTAKRYIELARTAPLYAWPSVNLKHMELAIEALNSSRTEILSFSDQYCASSGIYGQMIA